MKKLTVEMYVEIYKDIIRNVDDYADKAKVKKHNAAYTKLDKLLKEIEEDKPYLEELFGALMLNEDDKVKLSAATNCLNLNILTNKALECLNDLQNSNSLLGIDKLGIEMTLKRKNKGKN